MNTQTLSPMAERVAELEGRENHERTYRHEDGSVTVILWETDPFDHESPRDWDGNVATLISTSRDYGDLDDDIAGLSGARERWEWLGTFYYSSRGQRFPSAPSVTKRALTRRYDREAIMARYVAMFRPDIAYYCDSWQVVGHSQSDWQGGWGYVTTGVLEAYGMSTAQASVAFTDELKVYEQHFRGEYPYAVHLSPKAPDLISETVDYACDPVQVYGDDYDEDAVYGFLGYDDPADIAADFTTSPVVLP